LAEKAVVRASREITASQIRRPTTLKETPTKLSTIVPLDRWPKVVLPALPDEAFAELKRGRDPIATFRKWLRRLDIKAALEAVKARQQFAASKAAMKWLPSQA